jgi:hypothetical protein
MELIQLYACIPHPKALGLRDTAAIWAKKKSQVHRAHGISIYLKNIA